MRRRLLTLAATLMTLAATSACVSRRVVVVGRPYCGASYPPHTGYSHNTGEIRLETSLHDAGVFINGAYAGTARQNRSMRLRPGNYGIEIRAAGRPRYAESIYVVAGRTLHLHPGF
ncbi:MAG: PEGA domain-containing protein [Candidatus Solibacter sp.]|nr:PEGA domain-containing protein [Candidatus Solibacter sp.]